VVPSVKLYIRTTSKDGKRTYTLADKKKQAEDGVYCLRYDWNGKRIWKAVGNDLKSALLTQKTFELKLLGGFETLGIRLGPVAHKPEPEKSAREKKPELEDLRDTFISSKRHQRHKDGTSLDKETISAYEQHVCELLAVTRRTGHTYPDQVDGDDLLVMMDDLRRDDYEHHTICNHYTSVATFVKYCKIDHKELVPYHLRPTPERKDPPTKLKSTNNSFVIATTNGINLLLSSW